MFPKESPNEDRHSVRIGAAHAIAADRNLSPPTDAVNDDRRCKGTGRRIQRTAAQLIRSRDVKPVREDNDRLAVDRQGAVDKRRRTGGRQVGEVQHRIGRNQIADLQRPLAMQFQRRPRG